MAKNKQSLQVLRGSTNKLSNIELLPGQPLYNKTNKTFYIGSDTGTLQTSGINVESADKLSTARTITLGTGASATPTSFNGTQNITIPVTGVKEAYLDWGGKNLSGKISPIDNAMSNTHSANRLAFAKPEGIIIEYSRNGGNTWTEATGIDSRKVALMSGIGDSFFIGGVSTDNTVDDKLRVTLDAHTLGIYVAVVKILLNVGTNGASGCHVVVEKSTIGYPNNFEQIGDYPVSGWSGWNSIPATGIGAFGGSANQTSQTKKIRLTFGITGVTSNNANNFALYNLQLYSNTYWGTNSNMAKTGHLYSYDYLQNATFPATIKGTDITTSSSYTINNTDYGNPSLNELHKIVNTYSEETTTLVANKTLSFHLDTSELNTGLYVTNVDEISASQIPRSPYAKYIITWDGVDYEAWEDVFTRSKWDETTGLCSTWYDWECIGNGEKLGAYHPESTNLPFAISRDLFTNKSDMYVWAINSTAPTHTITIKKVTNHKVRKLNREYIYNYNNFLYQGKQNNSGSIGLNVVDGPSAFAVGDGNYIEKDPSVSGTQNQGAFISGGGNKLVNSSLGYVTGGFNLLQNSLAGFLSGYENKGTSFQAGILGGKSNTVTRYTSSLVVGRNLNVESQLTGYSAICSAIFGYNNTVVANGVDIVAGQGNTLTGPKKDPNVDATKIVQGNAVFGANNVCENLQTTLVCGVGNRLTSSSTSDIFGSFTVGSNNRLTGAPYSAIAGRYNRSEYSDTTVFGRFNSSDCQHQMVGGLLADANAAAMFKIGTGQIIDKSSVNLQAEYGNRTYYYFNPSTKELVQITSSNVSTVINDTSITTLYIKNNGFTVLNDGRAQVQTAPVETIDVVRKQELDGKANASHTHTVSQISDLTATATELNYMDGVTSNVQTQLNNKAKVTYKSYSAFGTASTGTDGWYTLFTLNDNTSGSALCLLKGYAHSSVVFTATKGHAATATLNVLDYNSSSNGSYAYVKALRILSDGKVQAQINTGTVQISIHVVSANGTLAPVSSLVCDTSTNPEVCVSRTLSHGKIIANGFVGDLSGNATSATKATQDGNGNNIVNTYVTLATTQTVSGNKTFSGVNNFSTTTSFQYGGIGDGTTNANRHVWFNDDTVVGRPVKNDNFKYNPSTQTLQVGTSNDASIQISECILQYSSSSKSISFNFN